MVSEKINSEINSIINNMISSEQYKLSQAKKEKKLLPIIKLQLKQASDNNVHIKSYFDKLNLDIDKISSLSEVPFVPVQMFKSFDLRTCKEEDVVRVLKSSSTTSQTPSKIAIDKITALRQTKALNAILSNFLGKQRRPFLVIDCPDINKPGIQELTARGAAVRGLSMYANETFYAMKQDEKGMLQLDVKGLREFRDRNADKEVLVFGFTSIIWSEFVRQMKEKGLDELKLKFKDVKVLHSGGWKRLKAESVSKDAFSEKVAELFSTRKKNIIDFYGMVEQTGVIFVDCEYENKHVPDFADVIIRDHCTMEEERINEAGLIEVISILPNSYAGQAILTEDVGNVIGIDDCKCGRKGKYFRFEARVEKAEIRGCGDTFTESI